MHCTLEYLNKILFTFLPKQHIHLLIKCWSILLLSLSLTIAIFCIWDSFYTAQSSSVCTEINSEVFHIYKMFISTMTTLMGPFTLKIRFLTSSDHQAIRHHFWLFHNLIKNLQVIQCCWSSLCVTVVIICVRINKNIPISSKS